MTVLELKKLLDNFPDDFIITVIDYEYSNIREVFRISNYNDDDYKGFNNENLNKEKILILDSE